VPRDPPALLCDATEESAGGATCDSPGDWTSEEERLSNDSLRVPTDRERGGREKRPKRADRRTGAAAENTSSFLELQSRNEKGGETFR